jgi:hypothetical protein
MPLGIMCELLRSKRISKRTQISVKCSEMIYTLEVGAIEVGANVIYTINPCI